MGVTVCFVCIHVLTIEVLVISSGCLRSSCACAGIETLVLFQCLEFSMQKFLHAWVETLVVLSKCLESSVYKLLCLCVEVEAFVVLLKCLRSSMHEFLYAWGLRHLLFCSSV